MEGERHLTTGVLFCVLVVPAYFRDPIFFPSCQKRCRSPHVQGNASVFLLTYFTLFFFLHSQECA